MRWGGLAGKIEEQGGAGHSGPGRPRVVIIGAGIAGLAAAYRLTRSDFCKGLDPEVLLLERSSRAGGVISTYELEDYLLELGPDMFQTAKPEAIDLCTELGLTEHIIPTNEKFRRTFIAHDGQLHAVPEGFSMMAPSQLGPFFSSSLLSFNGKVRMAMDLLLPKKSDPGDESLASFVRRRFGQEALERIAQPMVGGVYTADPETLSLQATFPRFLEMEQKCGSVIRGLMQEKKSKNGNGTAGSGDAGCRYSMFVSLNRGMGMLVERLVASLPPDTLHYQCPIIAVEKGTRGRAYDVIVANGTVVPTDAVILTTPAFASADMINKIDQEVSAELKRIQYSSAAVMNLIYNRADIPHALDGFGFVVPQVEKRTIMACSFASVKFPGRCPPEKAVLRVFVGGALQPDVFELTDEQIECLMWEDLHTYLGLKSVPLLSLITRYQRSMPQYYTGHVDRIKSIRSKLESHPGLAVAGAAYEGVGIPDCIASGQKAAREIVNLLQSMNNSETGTGTTIEQIKAVKTVAQESELSTPESSDASAEPAKVETASAEPLPPADTQPQSEATAPLVETPISESAPSEEAAEPTPSEPSNKTEREESTDEIPSPKELASAAGKISNNHNAHEIESSDTSKASSSNANDGN